MVALDLQLVAVTPAHSGLRDPVEAIVLAVRALVLRFGRDDVRPRERVVWLTGGRLYGHRPLPP